MSSEREKRGALAAARRATDLEKAMSAWSPADPSTLLDGPMANAYREHVRIATYVEDYVVPLYEDGGGEATIPQQYAVDAVLRRLAKILRSEGVLFARDHP